MAVPVGAANLHPPRPTQRRPRGEGIDRYRRSPTAKLPTARTSTLRETTIPPLCRRIGPGDWDHPDLAVVVAAWPELPEAIRAGIVAMVKAARD
jgi:hypothetical protein